MIEPKERKRKAPIFNVPLVCKLCGKETYRKSPVQKYCEPCSEVKDFERKSKWAKEHPKKWGQKDLILQKKKTIEERARLENRGTQVAQRVRRGMSWPATLDEDFKNMVRVSVPFSWSFSKNAIFSMNTNSGHVFLRKKARGVRDALTMAIKAALSSEQPFYRGKVWLDILVQKPNNRGDAVNLIDSICDAVKVAIGIDDRYFSIRVLDWEIVKENHRLFVGISQSIEEHHAVCAYCGRLVPETHLSAHKRTCKTCRHQGEFDRFMFTNDEKETEEGQINLFGIRPKSDDPKGDMDA
jgi:hypothetical protein